MLNKSISISISLLFASAAAAQTKPVTFQVTASIQSRQTTTANFGKLPSRYFAADWTITSDSTTAIKVPLAWVIQQVQEKGVLPANVGVLGPTSSNSVIQEAQGRSPLNTAARIGTGIISGFAACEGLKACPSGGSWAHVTLGVELAALTLQYVFPALQSHALQSISGMLPQVLNFDPTANTVSGIIIVEIPKNTPPPGVLVTSIEMPSAASGLGSGFVITPQSDGTLKLSAPAAAAKNTEGTGK